MTAKFGFATTVRVEIALRHNTHPGGWQRERSDARQNEPHSSTPTS
jgi:hypothetical protein